MKNEVSNILSLINNGDSLKALHEAKSFYNSNKNNLNAVKVLAYSYIQIGNFERVIEILKKGYRKRNDQMEGLPTGCPPYRPWCGVKLLIPHHCVLFQPTISHVISKPPPTQQPYE